MSKYKTRCFARVWTGTEHQSCHNTATLEYSGFHWCRLHHPPTVEAKAKKRHDEGEAEWEEKQARWAHQEKTNKLRDLAVEYLRERHPDALAALAKEVGL